MHACRCVQFFNYMQLTMIEYDSIACSLHAHRVQM